MGRHTLASGPARARPRSRPALAARVEQLQGLFVAQFDAHRRATLQRGSPTSPSTPPSTAPCTRWWCATQSPVRARSSCRTAQADRVLGLDDPTSEALLEELWSYCYAPAVVHEHRYAPGDFVVWDNLNVQHARGACTPDLPRRRAGCC